MAKTALEPVDALRLQLAETQGTVAALQATAAGESCGLCWHWKTEVALQPTTGATQAGATLLALW